MNNISTLVMALAIVIIGNLIIAHAPVGWNIIGMGINGGLVGVLVAMLED